MAYRKRVTRKAPVRRRRRSMGAAMSAASVKAAVNTTLYGAACWENFFSALMAKVSD